MRRSSTTPNPIKYVYIMRALPSLCSNTIVNLVLSGKVILVLFHIRRPNPKPSALTYAKRCPLSLSIRVAVFQLLQQVDIGFSPT